MNEHQMQNSNSLWGELGLSKEEFCLINKILDREPSLTELGIFSAMWSEHCSYKSSKKWLKILPTEGPQVIQGPGENAGVLDIGDGLAAVFKIESHNHPSFIEPYQGAATGVGGILRDVFTMGARPIANLNALRFGHPNHPKTRHLLSGVVAGIAGYGNCIGVPTVGGEVNFHPSYNGNNLVNAMTVGLASTERIFYSAASGIGNPVVYVGAKTGRDGIHGATMASAEFSDDIEKKRPTVQVGDPFIEKLLLEACLELMQNDAIIAIQDMGAAGLTSSSVEMAGKGKLGLQLDLDSVPLREDNMTAFEIMLSESQERMLMVLKPQSESLARSIFKRWGLDFAVIGKLTSTGRLVIIKGGKLEANIPIDPMVDASPEYDRPWTSRPKLPQLSIRKENDSPKLSQSLVTLMSSHHLASRRWIWEQYDHLVMNDTIVRPGGDAALLRVRDTEKILAMTVDCTPRYCAADPEVGGAQAVAEAWRNLTATGAIPLAITNNMNFGNPERPEIMGQFVGCIEGMRNACRALNFPVISGNVSLYNETGGKAILPTPVIGGVGLIEGKNHHTTISVKAAGESIWLIGATIGWLGQSVYLLEMEGREDGPPPPIDLEAEKVNGDFVRALINQGLVTACHDISDGGILVALAEMVLAEYKKEFTFGANLLTSELPKTEAICFGEDQGRYLVTTTINHDIIYDRATAANIPIKLIGTTTTDGLLTLASNDSISVEKLRAGFESWMPDYMQKF